MFTEDQVREINAKKGIMRLEIQNKLFLYPQHLTQLIKDHGILTGGCSASLFHNETPNDYDIYLNDQESIDKFKFMLDQVPVQNLIADISPNYLNETLKDGKVITANAVTFKNDIQIITMGMSNVREKFDFIHCMPYLNFKENKYYISEQQYFAIKNKKLIVNPTHTKDPNTFRISKFYDRGWSFNV